ncbi:hypothetical protein GYMLUDRAFT_245144 [Collybiopsis luxurians FD-317 M1]|uniref:Uncharacterized protein n=1 Tax=Collybiopsis luxurians FD-317 M1 TaxID=944289 RepID=A0A0D0CAI0_9AGAR|nr:hypothetical protein GYMLUDRAFT_245144 [Collybiopsis luxurians FD-317 M1]
MVKGYTYLSIVVLQLLNHLLEMLSMHPSLLVIWLPLSVWFSLWRLRRRIVHIPPSSLPLHNSERLVNENMVQSMILAVFLHAWLTTFHLFTVITSNIAYKRSVVLPAWFVLALANLFLVVGFAQYLEALAIPRSHWGHFFILHRIVIFVFDLVHVVLWIIDLCRKSKPELASRRIYIILLIYSPSSSLENPFFIMRFSFLTTCLALAFTSSVYAAPTQNANGGSTESSQSLSSRADHTVTIHALGKLRHSEQEIEQAITNNKAKFGCGSGDKITFKWNVGKQDLSKATESSFSVEGLPDCAPPNSCRGMFQGNSFKIMKKTPQAGQTIVLE